MYRPPEIIGEKRQPVEFIDTRAGIYFRSVVLAQFEAVEEHVHPMAHATYIGAGKARLWVDGEFRQDIEAGQAIEVEANKKHLFQALEEGTRIVCVWMEEVAEQMLKGM